MSTVRARSSYQLFKVAGSITKLQNLYLKCSKLRNLYLKYLKSQNLYHDVN